MERVQAVSSGDRKAVSHAAHLAVVEMMDAFEASVSTADASTQPASSIDTPRFVLDMAQQLRSATRVSPLEVSHLVGTDPIYRKLGIDTIGEGHAIPRLEPDAVLHNRILAYMQRMGRPVRAEDMDQVRLLAEEQTEAARLKTMGSYALHGLVPFGAAQRKGLLEYTSATPFDAYTYGGLIDVGPDGFVIGYTVDQQNSTACFTGNGAGDAGFYPVAMERPWERMDETFQKIPEDELANRVRSSMLFVVQASTIPPEHMEDTYLFEQGIKTSLSPKSIPYVVVGESNGALARQAFADTPIQVLEAPLTEVSLLGKEKPFTVYDFEQVVAPIVAAQGPQWCHIARMAADPYPVGFESFKPYGRYSHFEMVKPA